MLRPGLLQRLDELARASRRCTCAGGRGSPPRRARRRATGARTCGPVARAMDSAERGLADARRADEAEDGPLQLLHQRLHREVLEDALLGLLQAVVVLVEDPLGLDDVEPVLGLLVPGQREDPVDVVADDGGLGAHRAHHLELLQLLLDLERGLLAHPLGLELLLDLLDLVLELVALAQLLLNGLHLLIQVVLLLRLLHLLLDAGADLLLDLEDLDLALHQLVELLEPLGRRSRSRAAPACRSA